MFCDEKWANSIVKIDTREGYKKNPTKITVFLTQTVKNFTNRGAQLCIPEKD